MPKIFATTITGAWMDRYDRTIEDARIEYYEGVKKKADERN